MALKASPDDQKILLDLQALDTKLTQLDHKARALPQLAEIAALQSRVDALRITELERRGAAEDVALELKRLESDVDVVRARIDRDTQRAQTSSSAKDAQAFEHELVSLRKRQFDLEEIELSVMEKAEEADTALAEVTGQIDELRSQLAVLEDAKTAELSTLSNERTHAAANRSTIASKVPADLLALYEKQRARYGTGASLLQHGVSKASGVKLLENEMVAIRAAAPDDVIMCPSSDAILVRTSESGL